MKITWLGHSCFLIETARGTRIVLDPYESGSYGGDVAYRPVAEAADAVIVSHDHPDHNATGAVLGEPRVLIAPETAQVGDIEIKGVAVYHDEEAGRQRGANTIVVLSSEGLRLAHLGDLGHELDKRAREAVGAVDVALIPVGGYFTIDAKSAARVAEQLAARLVIPMHFKTPSIGFPIAPVDDFLAEMSQVERPGSATVELSRESLPVQPRVLVLEHAR